MALLAAIQPRRLGELVTEWSTAAPALWREAPRRLDEASDAFDPDLKRREIDGVIDHLAGLLERAGERGADLALLHECCLPLGVCRPALREQIAANWSYAEPRWLERAADLARRHQMVIGSCYYRAEGERLTNDAVIIDVDGEVAGIYTKVHLPCDVAADATEAGLFDAGDVYRVIPTGLGGVGVLICYDIVFPEAATALALNGADILLHPTVGYNFPDEEEVVAEARLRTRATDTSVPLVYSNFAPRRSAVFGSNGAMLACAGREPDAVAVAAVNLARPRRQDWGGGTAYDDHRAVLARKRRPDTYGVLTAHSSPYLSASRVAQPSGYEYRPEVGLGDPGE